METIEQTCDATNRPDVVALYDAVIDAFGGVDVLVSSASYATRETLLDVTEEQWDDVFDVQLKSAHRATRLFAREMDKGAILHIASASAVTVISNLCLLHREGRD